MDEFRAARADAWAELARLTTATKRRRGDQVLRLSRLHREAVADLALARRRWPGESLVDALEDLVAASHAELFAPGRSEPDRLVAWLRRGCWEAMAESLPWALAAVAVLAVAAVGGVAAGADVAPVALRRDIVEGAWTLPVGPLAAALAFAAACAGLVPAAVVLAWVGLESGATAAAAWQAGDERTAAAVAVAALPLATAVVFATAAGASAGWAVVRGERGEATRRLALGAQVLLTLVPLLVVGTVVRDAARTSPETAAAIAAVLTLAWWTAVLTRGSAVRRGRGS
ncbi:MAG TPA: hypothetical protein VM938_09465 [Acidimicrobiales bacterium]|nr:hypothetical protein [Acidimicrobiales bacterium]